MQSQIDYEVRMIVMIGEMAKCYPHVAFSTDNINAYVARLSGVDLDALSAAIDQCVAEQDFLPTVKHLRDKVFLLSSNLGQMPSGFEAWGLVKEQMSSRGFYRSPIFASALVARAVECIGWRNLCMSDNEVADRAHFTRVYETLLRRAVEDAKTVPAVRAFRERHELKELIENEGRLLLSNPLD